MGHFAQQVIAHASSSEGNLQLMPDDLKGMEDLLTNITGYPLGSAGSLLVAHSHCGDIELSG
eukprot:5621222-Alexandrium_andersonii.AAC.1